MRRVQILLISVCVFCMDTAIAGSLSFASSTYTVAENASTVTITVNRTGSTAATASVTVVSNSGTAEATDFTTVSQVLNWGIGDAAPKTFTVTIKDDAIVEGTENFTLKFTAASGDGTGGDATVSISDFEEGKLQFFADTFTGQEDNGQLGVVIQRYLGADGPATVKLVTTDGTPAANSTTDYTPFNATVSLGHGETLKSVAIPLINDDVAEFSEYFKVILSDATGASLGSITTANAEIKDTDEDFTSTVKLLTKTVKNVNQGKLIDLTQESLLDSTKKILDLVNSIPILTLTELSAKQDTDGLLTIDVEEDRVYLRPISVKRSASGVLPEINIRDDVNTTFVTNQGWLLEAQPALAAKGLSVLQKKLAEIFLPDLAISDTGNITIQVDQGAPPFERDSLNNVVVNYKFYDRWHLRPSMVSTVSAVEEEGFYLLPHPIDDDEVLMAVTYKDGTSNRQQILSPAPINGHELIQGLLKNGIDRCLFSPGPGCKVGVKNAKQLNNGIVTFDIEYSVPATGEKQLLQLTVFADYQIRKTPNFNPSMIGFTEMNDLNKDTFADYKMVYANGEEQYFFFVSSILK